MQNHPSLNLAHHEGSVTEEEADFAFNSSTDEEGQRSESAEGSITPPPIARVPEPARCWNDVFWLFIFVMHLIGLGFVLFVLGANKFQNDGSKLDRFTGSGQGRTEQYWPLYALSGGLGVVLAWASLLLLCTRANQITKLSVHGLTTYLAVVSVLCFWDKQIFWGIAFAIAAVLHFMYVMSVMDRFPFTMLVLKKAVKMVWNLPEVVRVSYAFLAVMLLWMVLWSFGVSGVIAANMDDGRSWWLLVVFSISLFWTGAVLCNTVHVIVAGMVVLFLMHGERGASSMPPKPLLRSFRHAVTTSLGSICYGSLFTAAIRTLRWEIRGIRSQIGNNECLLCCVDFLFNLVETLVRFFNKYAYVQVAVYGKSFNHSARDAWELFQSTGIESLIAYDCSGAVLLMGTILGGLISGTCVGVWTWFKKSDRVIMVGSTAMLMGMILVGLTLVVVESAVTSIYICYAEDPSLINRWDEEFYIQISEALHQRLQHRSLRGRDVLSMVEIQRPVSVPVAV
uniref:Choline transporter-like protein n=1 Tax=Wollemia nobilis TaxID=56998 RepID=A0A0C9QTX0_9CONI